MGKKRKAPEVLHRAYGARARTLTDTILSLLPPPPPSASAASECRCKGLRCLGCSGGPAARSFLLRDGDDSDYIRLLTEAYAVLSGNAPPLTEFDPCQRRPQRNVSLSSPSKFRILLVWTLICWGVALEIFQEALLVLAIQFEVLWADGWERWLRWSFLNKNLCCIVGLLIVLFWGYSLAKILGLDAKWWAPPSRD